ncbi:MAG: hypothetical protein JSR39_10800 [Verrucomicrobia bacterium]|nr:hypothetical protein [Verrucomicrobiota bacterium]
MKALLKKFVSIPDSLIGKVSMQGIWRVLATIAIGIALWFSSIAAYQLFQYFRLGSFAEAEVTKWSIKELSSSRFAIEAFFEFEANGKKYQGKSLLDSPVFLNPFSAEDAIKAKEKQAFYAWYQSSKPEISSLQREFPLKSLIHALVTLGVLIYFAFVPKHIPHLLEHELISPSKSSV